MDIENFYEAPQGNEPTEVATAEYTPEGLATAIKSGKVLGGVEANRSFADATAPVQNTPDPAPQSMETYMQEVPTPEQVGDSSAKVNEEVEKLKRELKEAQEYVEFGRVIEKDPNLYKHMESYFAKEEPKEEPLKAPELPEDLYDRDKMSEYNKSLLAYQEKLTERKAQQIASAQVQGLQQQLAQQQAQQAQQAQLNQEINRLQNQYQASADEVQEFTKWAQDARNTNIDNVFQLFRLANGKVPTATQPQNNNAAQTQQQRLAQHQANMALPQPLGKVSSAGATSATSIADLIKGASRNTSGLF
jgi:hypothetical protein